MQRLVIVLTITGLMGSFLAKAETVTIYRDDFGIAHIYAETAEAGLYAQGWAMAEDGLERTLENYLRGLGKFSAAYGAGENDSNVRADLESLMWDHYGTAKRRYKELPAEFRSHNAAFIKGINDYMDANPDNVPSWWTYGKVDVYMPIAFSRQFIWGWPAGQAAGDLKRIGIEPNYDVEFPYSNEMAVAPERTTFGAAALVIDPHLSWFGRYRYWEVRIHADDIHISGFATAGFPYVNLGHNANVAWAHTTGGPDTADVYTLELNPENALEYLYDGEYRKLKTKTIDLVVEDEEKPRNVTFFYSHHGPIVAREDNTAYAAALAYEDEIGYLESKYYFMIAEDYEDVVDALEIRQIMPQNVMVADTSGNIYYQRTGRTPIRPAGFDYTRPLDGTTSRTEWLGIHPTKDLIQVLNPPQGYMQNCNISPDVMMVGSPMKASKYPSYIFNQPAQLTHQRATRATELLHENGRISAQDMQDIALDKKAYQYERWVVALQKADKQFGADKGALYREGLRGIEGWDGISKSDSRGALLFYYWRVTLTQKMGTDDVRALAKAINNYLDFFGVEDSTRALSADEQRLLVDALEEGMNLMKKNHGDLDAVFGDVFRAGRLDYDADNVSWPVGGGSLGTEGIATVRAIGFTAPRADHTRWGLKGQTSTEVVLLTKPIQSFTQPPIGQSDHPDSPHFRDQAEKLLSASEFKPSWFNKKDLLDGHVKSTQSIEYRP